MTCTPKEYIYIFKGDDTNWNNEQFLTVNITSEQITLDDMTAKFILGSFSQTFPLTTGTFEVSLTKAVTGAYSFGPINGVIQILDTDGRIKTVSNTIPFYVTNQVQNAQNATFNAQVAESSPIDINIQVGGGSGVTKWGDIEGTLSDQTDLQNALNAKMNTSGGTFAGDVTLASGVSLNTQVGQIHDVNDNVVLGGKGTNYGLYVSPDGTAAALVGNGTLKDIVTTADVKSTYSATGTDPVNGTAVASAISTKQDTLSQTQLATVNSGIDSTKVGQIATNTSNISTIEGKIPAQASSSNQLADKNFVNSSISTNTANFIGTFSSIADLESYSGTVTNNDYAFVVNRVVTDNGSDWANTTDLNAYDKTLLTNFDYAWVVNGNKFDLYRFNIVNQTWELRAQDIHKDTSLLNTAYNRYKATVSGSTVTWDYEYTLNNSSFTAAQWAAINSGITDTAVTQIGTNTTNIGTLTTDKQPKTLVTPITVDGASQTTVESALGAINTLAASKQAAITGGASTITSDNLTANKALISDANGKVGASSVTSTELGYVSGVTSAIQTQINTKQPQTLSSAITVDGTTQTTVESALGAINTLAAGKISYALTIREW